MTQTIIVYAQIAVIWWFFAWIYNDYRVDLLRCRLFVLRDKLFEYAENGEIDFDDPAYRLTRTLLNGSLRFAHRLTFADVMIASRFHRKNPDSAPYHALLDQALHHLPLEQKKKIVDIHAELHIVTLSHIAHTSLMLWPFAFTFKLAIKLHLLRKRRMPKNARKQLEPFDSALYELGMQPSLA